MNVPKVLGITRDGNGIARRMHQPQRALYTNVFVTGSMAANMFGFVLSKDVTSFTSSAGVGFLTFSNVVRANKTFKNLIKDYRAIVDRAEKIYQKKIL